MNLQVKHSTCILLTLLLLIVCQVSAQVSPPNIVFILADDMGYGDLKAYNPDSKIPTPALDRLAREGIRFTDAHTTGSTCIPARFGLLTGTYPWRQPNMRDIKPLIPESMPTIASLLKSAGYRTHMVGKWHLGFDDKQSPKPDKPMRGGPMDRGFDSFFGIHASTDIPPYYYIRGRSALGMPMKAIDGHNDNEAATGWNRIQGAFWRGGKIGQDLKLPEVTPRFFAEAQRVIESEAGRQTPTAPFFLYLALPSPHTPWLPTEDFVGKSGAGSYGDFLMTVDHGVGQMLGQLDRLNLAGNTLVCFSSDNGPVWYAKDVDRFGHSSTAPLRGMKGDNWEGGHRIPFIVRCPRLVPAGKTSDDLISFLDVAATFGELAGVEKNIPADSISFLPALRGEKNRRPREMLIHGKGIRKLIRQGDWKLLMHKGSAGFSKDRGSPDDPPGQLYNVRDDISESTNLWEKHPEKVAELRQKLVEATKP